MTIHQVQLVMIPLILQPQAILAAAVKRVLETPTPVLHLSLVAAQPQEEVLIQVHHLSLVEAQLQEEIPTRILHLSLMAAHTQEDNLKIHPQSQVVVLTLASNLPLAHPKIRHTQAMAMCPHQVETTPLSQPTHAPQVILLVEATVTPQHQAIRVLMVAHPSPRTLATLIIPQLLVIFITK
jgi:hypothetical protein